MNPRNTHKEIAWFVVVMVIAIITHTACTSSKSYGPYSLSEVATRLDQLQVSEPVYAPPQDSSLIPVFYYIDLGSEGWLVLYLGSKGLNGQTVRVAKLRTSLLGLSVDSVMENSREVKVPWANNFTAFTCVPKPDSFAGDEFSGNSYQTCLAWRSGRYWFLLYSILSLDETVVLINSLERIR